MDYQNLAITRTGATRSITVPVVTVSLHMTDSATGAVVNDLTGAKAVDLWSYLGGLTPAKQDLVIKSMVDTCLMLTRSA